MPGYMYTIERKRRVPSRVRRATLTVDISARGGGAGRARPTAGARAKSFWKSIRLYFLWGGAGGHRQTGYANDSSRVRTTRRDCKSARCSRSSANQPFGQEEPRSEVETRPESSRQVRQEATAGAAWGA